MNQNETTNWQQAAEDIVLFRKGKLSREELTERYPALQCSISCSRQHGIENSVDFCIPSSCPLPLATQIIVNAEYEPLDKGLVGWINWEFSYCPEWENLRQIGELKYICTNQKSVKFRVWYRDKKYIDIRDCIRMGSHGDEDGYGVEADTWLVAHLNPDGSWRRTWFIEE